jgi:hypothetical protein
MSVKFMRTEEERHVGRFCRQLLRDVKPEHVADMIHMLWLLGHSEQPINVPDGRWSMQMPHGYLLQGEGPMGFAIEPPRLFPEAIPTDDSGGLKPAPLLESDTAGILRLCAQARRSERPARDQLIAQLHSLDCDLCEDQAVEAIELLIYDMIVKEAVPPVRLWPDPDSSNARKAPPRPLR